MKVLVAGSQHAGKAHIISSILDVEYNDLISHQNFQEIRKENIPIVFIECNPNSPNEMKSNLDSMSKGEIGIGWYVIPDCYSISDFDSQMITIIKSRVKELIVVFTNVADTESDAKLQIVKKLFYNPNVALFPGENTNSNLTYEGALNNLMCFTYEIIPEQFRMNWNVLIEMRRSRTFCNVSKPPEKVDFNGIALNVQESQIGHLNIIISGFSGTGKTTLINTLFGTNELATYGASCTKEIQEYKIDGKPISFFDTPGFELGESSDSNRSHYQQVLKYIDDRSQNRKDERIHIMWYLINEGRHRIEETDIRMIKEVSLRIPVFVVLTKNITNSKAILDESKDKLGAVSIEDFSNNQNFNPGTNIFVHQVLFEDFESIDGYFVKAHGISELIRFQGKMIQKCLQYIFSTSQVYSLKIKFEEAQNLVGQTVMNYINQGNDPFISKNNYSKIYPLINCMISEISRIFNIKIQEGNLEFIVNSGNKKEKRSKEIGVSIAEFLFGTADKVLSFVDPLGLKATIEHLKNMVFCLFNKKRSSEIIRIIGNTYADAIKYLAEDKQEITIENVMKAYKDSLEFN